VTPTITVMNVAARPFAAVSARTRPAELSKTIRSCLDQVWASLRARQIKGLGHNVVLYRAGKGDGSFKVTAGVQVASPIDADGNVVVSFTPAGRVACALHIGPYSKMAQANDAILAYCRANGLSPATVSWEVYGDWNEDESKLETEVFYLLKSSPSLDSG
jgi:effector-binding domain-containing protein